MDKTELPNHRNIAKQEACATLVYTVSGTLDGITRVTLQEQCCKGDKSMFAIIMDYLIAPATVIIPNRYDLVATGSGNASVKWKKMYFNEEVLKQNHMVVAYFPWYFTRRPAWKPRPQRGSGFHAGSPSEVSWKICNNKCGFVFIPRLYP